MMGSGAGLEPVNSVANGSPTDAQSRWLGNYVVLSVVAETPLRIHGEQPSAASTSGADDVVPVPRTETSADAVPDGLLVRLSAQKLWAERANPVTWECSTWIGLWVTADRLTWHTTDGTWLGQLERSRNGQHVSLALYCRGTYVGRQDAQGFHGPGNHSRTRRRRPAARSLPLPLAG